MLDTRIAVKFAYDGTNFFGYQRQKDKKTVEGEIVRALTENNIIRNTAESIFRSAGRTDRGVSAIGNVIAFNTKFKDAGILSLLNAKIEDCWFYGIKKVQSDFNPRYARQRWYRYFLFDRNYDADLMKNYNTGLMKNHNINSYNISIMKRCSKYFIGTHDFRNFARMDERSPIRTIDSIMIKKSGKFILIDVRAENFLWNMVRRIVEALKKAGKGEISITAIKKALDTDTIYDFGVAPPEPLILMDTIYDFEFDTDVNICKRIERKLAERIWEMELHQNILTTIARRCK
ncbi:MAG: tRNA pseudouridine(38-40) synthase TruA [Thermoplasmata archaeon]